MVAPIYGVRLRSGKWNLAMTAMRMPYDGGASLTQVNTSGAARISMLAVGRESPI